MKTSKNNKIRTTIYLDETLRDLAISRGLNLSQTVEDTLEYMLKVSDRKQELLKEKEAKLIELNALNSKIRALEKEDESQLREQKKQHFQERVQKLREFVSKNFNDNNKKGAAVDKLVAEFGLTRAQALKELGL